jgi:hypothetical protein
MPTNLPPDYYEAEKRFRSARSAEEKVALLEEMFSLVPKHKGTDHLRADLRRRMSELRAASEGARKGGPSRQLSPYHIDREGAGQVIIVGPPNVGKSALVAATTNAEPEVAPYPMTTWGPTPGMLPYENVQIQLIDTPPLNPDHVEPDMMALVRRADLVLLMVDLQAFPIEGLEEALAFLEGQGIVPESRAADYSLEERHWTFVPVLVAVNKVDDESLDEDFAVLQELLEEKWLMVPISVETGRGIQRLKETLFEALDVIRVYSKPPGKEADLTAPFIMRRGGTVEEFAGSVHRDFLEKLQSARVWGHGVYDGQMVGRDHVLHDGDIVELRI